MEFLFIRIIICLITGFIAAAIASSKGRNVVGWFFVGFFFNLLGIIIAACMSNLNAEQARHTRAERERRLLREQLRQERLKSESYRQYTMARLDAHDGALDMDTRSAAALPGQAGAAPAMLPGQGDPESAAGPVSADARAETWYYEASGRSVGPVSLETIRMLMQTGSLPPSTLVWTAGMSDWAQAGQVPALSGEAL